VLARLEVSDRIEDRSVLDDGRWLVEGNAYDVVTVPVGAGDNPIGTLSIGFAGKVDTTGLEDHLLALAASSLANDLLRELRQTFAPDLIAIAGADSSSPSPRVELCRVSYGEDFSSYEPVVDALNGLKVSDFYVEAERLYHLVAVPVFARENIIGTLSAGFMIDDTLAASLGEMMDSLHVSFVHDGRVVASTWEASERRELQHWVQGGLQADHPVEVMIAAETYLSLEGEFTPTRLSRRGGGSADRLPDPGGYYIIQLSSDRALEFLDELERVLLLIGLGVMVVGGLLSFLGARRITRPILALVDGTERLAAGDLQHRLDVKTRSEIGQLARSFNDMVGALSHSRLALEESERAYRDLFDNAQDLVFTTDLDMQITSVNKAGLQSLGYGADEVLGRSMYSLLAPADAGRVQQQEELTTGGERRPAYEASFVRSDGSRETFEFVSRWIVENGVTTGVHAIGRDISERREQATLRFREQLHQAEKLRALGEMAAGVAHNFNNLLTVVLGNAELINMHEDLPPALKADTERILESAQRCSAIVRRIQTFGRPIDTEQRGRVDLTSPKWKSGPARAGHPVSIDTDLGDVPTIESQGAAWEDILSNLIFNAVDAMPSGGTIAISTRHAGGEIVLAVADEGIGMDEET
jgi:PAS domain S-box-containing protein